MLIALYSPMRKPVSTPASSRVFITLTIQTTNATSAGVDADICYRLQVETFRLLSFAGAGDCAKERCMNDRRSAEELRDLSLQAVSQLSQILNHSRDRCSQEEFERMKKGIGLAIGQVQTAILDMIYSRYPDLDDLK